DAEGVNHAPAPAVAPAPDRKVLDGALRLRAPQPLGRDLDLAERVVLDPRFLHGATAYAPGSPFGGGLGGQRVGARVEVREIVAPGPGGGVSALVAEAHGQPSPVDEVAARLHELGDE